MFLFSLERPHGFVWKHPLPVYLTADSLRPFVCLPSSLVQCVPTLRARVFNYTRNLQGQRNSSNSFYFVNQQYPGDIEAERQEMQSMLKQIKSKNLQLPPDQQVKASLKGKSLYINNQLYRKPVAPPTVQQLEWMKWTLKHLML